MRPEFNEGEFSLYLGALLIIACILFPNADNELVCSYFLRYNHHVYWITEWGVLVVLYYCICSLLIMDVYLSIGKCICVSSIYLHVDSIIP